MAPHSLDWLTKFKPTVSPACNVLVSPDPVLSWRQVPFIGDLPWDRDAIQDGITMHATLIAASVSKFIQEHLEQIKVGGIIIAVLLVVLPALWFTFSLLLGMLRALLSAVLISVIWIFNGLVTVGTWLFGCLLAIIGFGSEGVIAGSFAACIQSVVYGGFTSGIFSIFQALGAACAIA